MTEVEIREPATLAELAAVGAVFDQVWGAATPVVETALLRAVQHAGGFVASAHADGLLVGASFGFLAIHRGEPALHSHVTGVLPGVRGTGTGLALKRHQRAWAETRGLRWITWTFDPLVRRNAHFNLAVLGARVEAYLVDFYGPLPDAVNKDDATDRLLVAWPVVETASPARATPTVTIPTPEDVVVLRRTTPDDARAWRLRMRAELGDRLSTGGRVVGFNSDGEYEVAAG